MQCVAKFILKLLGWVLLLPVYLYKYAISPLTPASCRHYPTCSEYAVQALKVHGPIKGFWLATKRISKCHPWGTHGYDPVPPKESKTIPGTQKKGKLTGEKPVETSFNDR